MKGFFRMKQINVLRHLSSMPVGTYAKVNSLSLDDILLKNSLTISLLATMKVSELFLLSQLGQGGEFKVSKKDLSISAVCIQGNLRRVRNV
jgi:hypothetical protein